MNTLAYFWHRWTLLELNSVMGFLDVIVVNNLFANAGDTRDMGLIPGSWRSSGVGNDNSFQYSCLENPMDRGAWWPTVHGFTKNQTWPSTHRTHIHTHTSSNSVILCKQIKIWSVVWIIYPLRIHHVNVKKKYIWHEVHNGIKYEPFSPWWLFNRFCLTFIFLVLTSSKKILLNIYIYILSPNSWKTKFLYKSHMNIL